MGKVKQQKIAPPALTTREQVLAKTQEQIKRAIPPSMGVAAELIQNPLTSSMRRMGEEMEKSIAPSVQAIREMKQNSLSASLIVTNAMIGNFMSSSNAVMAVGIGNSMSSSAAAIVAGIGKSISPSLLAMNAAIENSIASSNAVMAAGIGNSMSSSAAAIVAGIGKSIASSSLIANAAIENFISPSLLAMNAAIDSSISPSLLAMKGLREVISVNANPVNEAIEKIGVIAREQTKIREELQELADQSKPRVEAYEKIQELAREQVNIKSKLQEFADQSKLEVDFLLYVQAVAVFQEKFSSELQELAAKSKLKGDQIQKIRTLAIEQSSYFDEIRKILSDRLGSQSDVIEELQILYVQQLEFARALEALADRATPQVDAFLRIKSLSNREETFGIDVKRNLNLRDLSASIEDLSTVWEELDARVQPMIVSAFISKSAQEWLKARGISYADATGNFSIVSPSTGTFLSAQGADTNPWRMPGRPTKTLKGKAPSKIVRALIDTSPPFSIPELIKRAKSSSGVAYRAIELLESEGLVVREDRLIVEVNWPKLAERWSDDYSFFGSNSVMSFIYPRGIDAFLDKLKAVASGEYAITGSLAAGRLAPYAETRQVMMYAKSPQELAERLGAKMVDSGANVLIAATEFDVVFQRTVIADGLNFVSPSQAAVDLLKGPGRNPAEGQELLDWMVRNESKWRD